MNSSGKTHQIGAEARRLGMRGCAALATLPARSPTVGLSWASAILSCLVMGLGWVMAATLPAPAGRDQRSFRMAAGTAAQRPLPAPGCSNTADRILPGNLRRPRLHRGTGWFTQRAPALAAPEHLRKTRHDQRCLRYAAAARVPADRGLPRRRPGHRRGAAGGAVPDRGPQSRSGEGLRLRVRLQRLRRRAHEVRRALLPGVDPVHHLRPRGGVPVPVGRRASRRSACLASGR